MDNDYQRYRREMEEAVSNQGGSSPFEVIFALLPISTSILLTLTLINLLGSQISNQTKIFTEFVLIVIPCILSCTICADQSLSIFNFFLILATANILLILIWKPRDSFKTSSTENEQKIPFITHLRAMTNILTCVCILAVDFPCFPRKFVKTETTGFSLMDAGTGFFIVTNALVAPQARNIRSSLSFKESLKKTLTDCAPLLALGFIRSISIELLGYQSHVTEYGKHWNFFFTLAFVKLFTDVLLYILLPKLYLFTGVWILGMYEWTLYSTKLKEYILSDYPRDDLISANREGLFSLPGYVGLYLISLALGRLIHSTYQKTDNQLVFDKFKFNIGYTRNMTLALKFSMITIVMFLTTFYCSEYFDVSRRLANSGYCAWILFLCSFTITILLTIDVILDSIITCISEKTRRTSKVNTKENMFMVKNIEIFDAVNENGLVFFLFSNLLTFAVNMSIKTLHTDSHRAVFIIISYMLANLTLVLLRSRGKNILSAKKKN